MNVKIEDKESITDWSIPQLLITEQGKIVLTTGGCYDEDTFSGIDLTDKSNKGASFSVHWQKSLFKKFTGTVTITN